MKNPWNHPLAALRFTGTATYCRVVAYIVHAAGTQQSVWMFARAAL